MITTNKGNFQPDSDLSVTFEDLQKINKFARLHHKTKEFKLDLNILESDLENIKEALDDIELLEDKQKIPYMVGEVYIYQNADKTENCLENAKKEIERKITDLKMEYNSMKDQIIDLKSHLYGRFGNQINLEVEE